jgi:hypothetical protein
MSEEGLAQSGYESESAISYSPDREEITGKFMVAILLFLSGGFFAMTLSDIQGFIEDHGFGFKNIEFVIILGFLVAFYIVSKIIFRACLYSYNITFPQKKCQIKESYQLLISILISFPYMYLVIAFLVPALAPNAQDGGAERAMLFKTVLLWLISILFMNVLLNSSRFVKRIANFTYKNILCLTKHKSNRRDVNE